jgi:hypothetical protein
VAFAKRPTAVALPPVAAEAAQVPKKPVSVDWHGPAKAGAPPNTVTIPAAIAKPRKAPPASALAPNRRARRLPGMLIDSHTTAMRSTGEPVRVALILFVFMSAPRLPLSDIGVA